MSTSDDVPGYGPNKVAGQGGRKTSGAGRGGDPTAEPGQYPSSLFGMPLPQGTGAPGSQGARGAADPTNQPGQVEEGFTGLGPSDVADTGAPGSAGASPALGQGEDTVTYTPMTAGLGTYRTESVQDEISGPGDWTAANDQGYASGGPQLPGVKGNEPSVNEGPYTANSGGRVLRGGRGAS
jgi:hypothetical protein